MTEIFVLVGIIVAVIAFLLWCAWADEKDDRKLGRTDMQRKYDE